MYCVEVTVCEYVRATIRDSATVQNALSVSTVDLSKTGDSMFHFSDLYHCN